MKIRKHSRLRPLALATVGVVLGRGAQADTIIDFETPPAGVSTNGEIPQEFGDKVLDSREGLTVDGFGTPNIGLSWQATGGLWHYYLDGVWAAVQLDDSQAGDAHTIVFAPNNPAARVVVKSFNFHPYYVSSERFTYDVSLLADGTVVSGPTTVTFLSDATKDHPVALNHTGTPGQTLELRIERIASVLEAGEIEGDGFNIAIDDVVFAQDPATLLINGPEVVSVAPADNGTGVAAVYSYRAGIADADTAVVPGSIQLKLDGTLVSPPPTVSPPEAGVTNVAFAAPGLLAPGSTHTYTLTYNDTGTPPASYTHAVQFTVINYPTLSASYANPSSSAGAAGFTCRTVMAPLGTATLEATLARAKAQLNGTLIDPATELPFENAAEVGPNPDGSFDVDTVLNFDDDGALSGHFDQDTPFPGLSVGGNNSFSTQASLFLDLVPGYYRLGVNSDDGFEVSVGSPAQGPFTAQTILGFFDNGRAADDTVFDFLVQTGGIHRFRLIMFEGGGSASCEFYSVDLATGARTLINDLTQVGAIKSYRSLSLTSPPRITSVVRNGSDLVIEWVDGSPPFQLQSTATLATGSWLNLGAPTPNRTATVPIQPGAEFVRVMGQ